MIQNIIIVVILAGCALYVGRRFYTNLRNNRSGCGCGADCTKCGPDLVSLCSSPDSDPDNR
ncbi:MAG: hypothetical protein Kow0089_03340 [Desulfobulbaceae bacterium]